MTACGRASKTLRSSLLYSVSPKVGLRENAIGSAMKIIARHQLAQDNRTVLQRRARASPKFKKFQSSQEDVIMLHVELGAAHDTIGMSSRNLSGCDKNSGLFRTRAASQTASNTRCKADSRSGSQYIPISCSYERRLNFELGMRSCTTARCALSRFERVVRCVLASQWMSRMHAGL